MEKLNALHTLSLFLIAFASNQVSCSNTTNERSDEYRLKTDWPDQYYDKSTRPVWNESDVIRVEFDVGIGQIVDVNTKRETFSANFFLRLQWKDQFLTWDPADYNGLNKTNLSPDLVWVPDIVLQNNADGDSELRGNLEVLTKKVIVSYNGKIEWLSLVVLQGICPMDVRHFPYDVQVCTLKFASWTYDGKKLDIVPKNNTVDLKDYTDHSEWEMISAEQIREELLYPCCVDPFPVLTVRVTMRRRPLFHILHLIIPMVLVALLTLYSFNIPARSGERISYGVTLLLAMTLFMLLLAEMIPAAADALSKLGIFFNVLIVEMVFMIFMMCYVARMYNKSIGDNPIPHWMRTYIFDNLSYKLFVRELKTEKRTEKYEMDVVIEERETTSEKSTDCSENSSRKGSATENPRKVSATENNRLLEDKVGDNESRLANKRLAFSRFKQMGKTVIGGSSQSDKATLSSFSSVAGTVTQLMKRKNDLMIAQLNEERKERQFFYEWRICAITMDRVCLIAFTLLFVVTTLTIFSDF